MKRRWLHRLPPAVVVGVGVGLLVAALMDAKRDLGQAAIGLVLAVLGVAWQRHVRRKERAWADAISAMPTQMPDQDTRPLPPSRPARRPQDRR